ncbi:hypothetical protein J7L68_09585 [bacterium]|nr:hypothetical protein [bacterium]
MKYFTIFILTSILFATPYWDFENMQNFENSYSIYRNANAKNFPMHYTPSIPTSYPVDFDNACEFVANWQLADSDSVDYGGIIEAETGELRDVIQTDNTQESVIIWSMYRNLFDLERFDSNLTLSLIYISHFPAYNEEVSEYSFYYPVWNSGLAMSMTKYYTQYYADSSLIEYGDSCAQFVIDNILPLDTPYSLYNLLHCFVNSFVAGCLAQYGEFRGNDYYIAMAESIGIRSKEWAEIHPDTAYGMEIWAMSPGTMIWGILKSYFVNHPDELDDWITEYVEPYVPDYASPPDEFDVNIWDNAWNIWYANGYRALSDATADSSFYRKYRWIVDYLLAQDTDLDGGIPASAVHSDTMDMTWVTTYLVFMGLEGIWDSLAEIDAGAIRIQKIGEVQPYYIPGDTIRFAFETANCGVDTISSVGTIITCDGDTLAIYDDSIPLGESFVDTILWIPDSAGDFTIKSTTECIGDTNVINDTISFQIHITPMVSISGFLTDSAGTFLNGSLIFYSMFDSIEPLAVDTIDSSTHYFDIVLPQIYIRAKIAPEFPYPSFWLDSVDISTIGDEWNIVVPYPQVLVVENDSGMYSDYFVGSLDSIDILYSIWDRNDGEIDFTMLEPFRWQTILWFTGDLSESTLTADDQNFLSDFIDSGGKIIITGQYIAENIVGTEFWDNYIGANITGNAEPIILYDIFDEARIISTRGEGSALNQISVDWMTPPEDAIPWLVKLSSSPDTNVIAFSRNFSGGGKIFFSSLGFEGIGKVSPIQESRTEFFEKIFYWANPAGIIDNKPVQIPQNIQIFAYPNPFNSSCKITMNLWERSPDLDYRDREVSPTIEIYDLRGNVVTPYPAGVGFVPLNKGDRPNAQHEGQGVYIWTPAQSIASGIYLVWATMGNGQTITKRIVYLK